MLQGSGHEPAGERVVRQAGSRGDGILAPEACLRRAAPIGPSKVGEPVSEGAVRVAEPQWGR